MANGENAEKNGRPGRELWGKRRLAGWVKSAANKRPSRRLDRRTARLHHDVEDPTDEH